MADSIAVLHVEDDASFADLTATYLERDHPRFVVTVETDPIAAMDHLSAHDPDCIVSDYDMPRRSGIELLEAVRERHPTLPFILFTGKGSEEVASEAISTGVTDYLQKQPGTDQFALLANKIDNAVEHHRTERQLASEQRRRAALFSNFPEPTLAIDYVDGEGPIIRAVNPAFEATFGFDAEEAVGQSINDLIVPPGDHDAARDLDDLALEGNPVDTEVRRETSSGPRDFLFRSIPVDGDVDFYGVYADITERKARERELRRVRDILDKAERIAQVGGWEIRTDAMEVFWTENCFDLLGIDDRTEPPLDDALDLYHEEDQARVEAAIEHGIEEEASFDIEARLGGGRWLRIGGEPVVEDDSVVALRGAVQDVTDRKERERELQRETQRFEAVFEGNNDPMFILDVDADAIVDANPAAERLLGYARDELRSEVSISDIHPDDMDKYETFLRRVRDDDLGRRERFTCVTKAGEHRDCEISVATTDLDRDTYQIATVRELTQPSS